jgi:hypothetical protein
MKVKEHERYFLASQRLNKLKMTFQFYRENLNQIFYSEYLRTMVEYNSEQPSSSCANAFAWDDNLSMVIDFDEDDLFSFTGHDSFMSFCENDGDRKSACININDSMKQDDRQVDIMTENTSAVSKHDGNSWKPHVVGRPIPLVDMLGGIVSVRAMELQQQHEGSQIDADEEWTYNESQIHDQISLDKQLEIAQKKLEDSIRRSQITRPIFIQYSECMMRKKAFKQHSGTSLTNN